MTPARQLVGFLAKFSKEVAAQAREAIKKMRSRLPGALELVYDNYNALVIGYGPSEHASEAIFSIALYPRYVTLFFLQGARLPDPDGLLQGSGNIVRYIRLTGGAATLDKPRVRALMKTALRRAEVPLDPKQRRRLIIRSISAKQRPRRPA